MGPALLSRWEAATEETRLWQFQPTVINGSLSADSLLFAGSEVTFLEKLEPKEQWEAQNLLLRRHVPVLRRARALTAGMGTHERRLVPAVHFAAVETIMLRIPIMIEIVQLHRTGLRRIEVKRHHVAVRVNRIRLLKNTLPTGQRRSARIIEPANSAQRTKIMIE